MRNWAIRAVYVATAAVLALAVSAFKADAAPVSCRIGAFVTSIHDVDTAAGTFKADFWMWSVCPTKDAEPLKSMEFLNAAEVTGGLDATLEREGGMWWSTRKVAGKFRNDFNLKTYPFDRQPLVVRIEEAVLDTRDLTYVPDSGNSGVDPEVRLAGWRLVGFALTGGSTTHPTTYGDPSLPKGSSTYASLKLSVQTERNHVSNLLKATFPLYVGAFLALVAMLYDVVVTDMFLGRMGVMSATMFAVVLSFINVDKIIGQHDGLYLLDRLHAVSLVLILVATAWSALAHLASLKGFDKLKVRRWDRIVGIGLAVLFVVGNAVLFSTAISSATATAKGGLAILGAAPHG